jgi:hypothetical protein
MAVTTFGLGPAGGITLYFWPDETNDKSYALRMVTAGHEHGIALPNGHFQQTFYFVARPSEILTGPQTSREAMVALERLLKQAVTAHRPGSGEVEYVYVHERSEGEPGVSASIGARRALIYQYELKEAPTDLFWDTRLKLNRSQIQAVLSLERGPWEETVMTALDGPSTLSYSGGSWQLPGSLGSLDGRILRFRFQPATSTLKRAWIGIKPKYLGSFTPSYVVNPVLSSVDAYDGTDAFDDLIAQSVFDTGFGAGSDLKFRVSVRGSYMSDMSGEYLVLIAARVTAAGTVCRTRFSTSYAAPGGTAGAGTYTYDFKKEEAVTDTEWRVIEAGVAQIPFGNASMLGEYMDVPVRLNVEAERLAGSGHLRIARIFLLPGHHRVFVDQANAAYGHHLLIWTTPTGQVECHRENPLVGLLDLPPVDAHEWRYPTSQSLLVFVGENAAGWRPSHNVTGVGMTVLKRWRSYRSDS